jgi:hypothetical protein
MTIQALTDLPFDLPHETLAECWARLADGGPSWTLDVLDVLEPFVLGRPADGRDVVRYRDLPWTAAAQLLQRLPAGRLADRQNAAPSLGSVLVAAVGHPREVEVLVPPSRPDERITAEGVVVYDHPELEEFRLLDDARCADDGCECSTFWASVQASFGLDDAERGPDVITRRTCRRTGRDGWYLWWT